MIDKEYLDKSKATDPYDWHLDGETPKYIDLKCKRAKSFDKVIFEDKKITRYQIDSILYRRKRKEELESFLNDDTLTHCYIMKRGTYYRPHSCGYTSQKSRAGIYTIKEGVEEAVGCEDIYLERVSKSVHNAMLEKAINEIRELML